MELPFPKTSHFIQKQELCGQIAKVYRTMYHKTINYEAFTSLGRSHAGIFCRAYIGACYSKSAEKYERLANSRLLYLIRESRLRQVIETLPLPTETIIF